MSSASGSPTSTWSQFEEESIYKAARKGANMDTVALFGISADGLDLSTDSAGITRNSEANMSSDTNMGLGRRTRLAYCTLAPLVGLFTLATPLVGQAKPGPFYHFNYYEVRPGDEKAHDSALVNVLTPLFNEMVKRKAMVSYRLLTKTAGSGERSEEHTSELQSRLHLVCRLLLEKKKNAKKRVHPITHKTLP